MRDINPQNLDELLLDAHLNASYRSLCEQWLDMRRNHNAAWVVGWNGEPRFEGKHEAQAMVV